MISLSQLTSYGCSMRPSSDTSPLGGSIDLTTRVEFFDLDVNDYVQLVSESSSEDVLVQVYGRTAEGVITNVTLTANGRNPVLSTIVFERLMMVEKIGSASLPIAVERKTPVFQGAAAGGGVSEITLPASASSSDGAYNGMLVRLTSGTGAGQIARILGYVGSTRVAMVDARWSTPPTNLTGFRISSGILLRSITQRVRRPFWNAICGFKGDLDRYFYDKVFLRNDNDTDTLSSAQVLESWNPSGLIQFQLDSAVDASLSTVNRRTAPSLPTFDRSPKQVPGLNLNPLSAIGVWLELRLPAGYPPVKSSYGISLTGTTV